jgi:hypothetical protein
MNQPIIGQMDSDEFETPIEGFIEARSGEDDRLPAQTFSDLLAEQQEKAEPLEIHVSGLGTEPVITAPSGATQEVDGRHIRFADDRELILHFDQGLPEEISA